MPSKKEVPPFQQAQQELQAEYVAWVQQNAVEKDEDEKLKGSEAGEKIMDKVKTTHPEGARISIKSIVIVTTAAMCEEINMYDQASAPVKHGMKPRAMLRDEVSNSILALEKNMTEQGKKLLLLQQTKGRQDIDEATLPYDTVSTTLYKGKHRTVSVAEALAVGFANKHNIDLEDSYPKVRECFGMEAIQARAAQIEAARQKNVPSTEATGQSSGGESKPKTPLKLEILPQETTAESLKALIRANAVRDHGEDQFSRAAFTVLADEIEFAEKNKLNRLLQVPVLMRALSYATGLTFDETPRTDSEANQMTRLLHDNSAKAEAVLAGCGMLLCAAGALPRDEAKTYITDKVRVAMEPLPPAPDLMITNRLYKERASALGSVHETLLKVAGDKSARIS